MTDLTDFGVEIDDEPEPEADEERQESSAPNYRDGRCAAINVGDRQRCSAPVSRMLDAKRAGLCGTHDRASTAWTIHDDPEKLIMLTGRLDGFTLADVDPDDVSFDVELIRRALEPVSVLREGDLPVVDGRIWLPRSIQHADQIVVRQREVTQDWRSYHGEGWVIYSDREDRADGCDAQNPELDRDEVRVKEYGSDAETYQLRFIEEGRDDD